MSQSVLIINNDPSFIAKTAEILLRKVPDMQIAAASNRDEAIALLQKDKTIDTIIMPLSIPRVADGYIFLAKVANKLIPSKNIVVLAQKINEQIEHSVKMYGIEHLYTTAEMNIVAQEFRFGTFEKKQLPGFDTRKVQEALNEVMGPIGPFIFEKSYKFCKSANDITLLVEKIIDEIGDREKAMQFYRLCAAAA